MYIKITESQLDTNVLMRSNSNCPADSPRERDKDFCRFGARTVMVIKIDQPIVVACLRNL